MHRGCCVAEWEDFLAVTLLELIAAFFFVASSGLFFNERFRSNRWLILCAGVVALASTYFLTEELIDRAISRRLEPQQPQASEGASQAGERTQSASAMPPPPARAEEPVRTLPPSAIALPEMVSIPGQNFEVGRYEVTFAQWDACVAAGGCNGYRPPDQGWGRGNRPVINVNWNDAQAYVQWLSHQTGQRYRLLTSSEWEFAARAGATTNFSWGDQDPVCDQSARNGANFSACRDDRTQPVGSFQPNGFGLYDVHGNAWEWVEDPAGWWTRGMRGGSWNAYPQNLRFAYRGANNSSTRLLVGFRVARTV